MTSELRARLEALADRMEPALMGTPPDCHDECAHGPCICSGARPVFAWSGVSPDDLRALLAQPVAEDDIRAKVEASSLGTPEAQALRSTVSDEHAARIVARARELESQPAAPQGGDVETLAELLTTIRAERDGNRAPRDYYRRWAEVDADRIASDWLAARDAEVARAMGERIAVAIEALPEHDGAGWPNRAYEIKADAATIARAASEETR